MRFPRAPVCCQSKTFVTTMGGVRNKITGSSVIFSACRGKNIGTHSALETSMVSCSFLTWSRTLSRCQKETAGEGGGGGCGCGCGCCHCHGGGGCRGRGGGAPKAFGGRNILNRPVWTRVGCETRAISRQSGKHGGGVRPRQNRVESFANRRSTVLGEAGTGGAVEP
jgi:hypothetical protein